VLIAEGKMETVMVADAIAIFLLAEAPSTADVLGSSSNEVTAESNS
jgi:hypothetical protein